MQFSLLNTWLQILCSKLQPKISSSFQVRWLTRPLHNSPLFCIQKTVWLLLLLLLLIVQRVLKQLAEYEKIIGPETFQNSSCYICFCCLLFEDPSTSKGTDWKHKDIKCNPSASPTLTSHTLRKSTQVSSQQKMWMCSGSGYVARCCWHFSWEGNYK